MTKPYYKNPRKITDKKLGDLDDTLTRLGDLSGIVHDLNTDEIIGGNQRSKVFRLDECEIVLTEEYAQADEQGTVGLGYVIWKGKKYSYRQVRWDARTAEEANIVANKAGGEWNFEMLTTEFSVPDLVAWGFEPIELGIEDENTTSQQDPGAQIDRAEELREKWSVELGQMWSLDSGKGYAHRLICGDCTDRAVVERVMGGEKADLFLTDPPYGVAYADKNAWLNSVAKGNRIQTPIENDHDDIEQTAKSLWLPSFSLARECCCDTASFYVSMPQGGDQMMMMMMMMSEAGWMPRHELIWLKNNHVLGRADYNYKHEPILYGWKRKGTHKFYGDFQTSVIECDKPQHSDFHPTTKPVELIARLIPNNTQSGEIVYDPFLGSGTTLIACEQLSRKCRAVEISPAYVAVALQRWADMTGQTPELLGIENETRW